MNRRLFVGGGAATLGMAGIAAVAASRRIPGHATSAARGKSAAHPIPLGTPTRLGDWTLTVHDWVVAGQQISVNLTAVYHGTEPRQVFQDLDFNLLGHDKRLHTLFDGTPDNDASHALFDMVTDGATVDGSVAIAMPADDTDHADDVLLVVQFFANDGTTVGILRPSTYVYFSLNMSAG